MNDRWPKWLKLNESLKALTPYGAPQISLANRLNTNENPYELSASLQASINAAIAKEVKNLNRYPDRDAINLRSALADEIKRQSSLSFGVENIWVANGSNEILQSIALAFSGDAMGFEPSYSMHPLINRSAGKKWISIPRRADFSVDIPASLNAISEQKPGLVYLTTPNNPSGNTTDIDQIESLAKTCQEVGAIFVVDEAYAEFSNSPSALLLLHKFPNLIISRTMSKAFAFAGVRVGYMIADPILIEAMLLIRLPYHLSSLTQAAALAALSHSQELSAQIAQIIDSRKSLARELESLGLVVIESEANFLLFTGFKESSGELFSKLVDKGVLIRDVSIPGYLRVTIGTEDENKAFLAALTSTL